MKPRLPSTFKADVKKLLEPIHQSFQVTVEPTLAKSFRTDLRDKVAAASVGVGIKVEATPTLSAGFKTDLKEKVKTASAGIKIKVPLEASTAGLKRDVTEKVKAASQGISVKVPVDLRTVGLKTALRQAVNTAAAGVTVRVPVDPDITGFKTALRNKVKTAQGGISAKITANVDADVTQATAQLEAFRTAQHAIPLTLNVAIDTASATAHLLALRAILNGITNDTNRIGSGFAGGGGGSTQLKGNIFTRPYRAVKLQIEVDKASVAKAEAEVSSVAAKLASARQRHSDALDKQTLAEQRHSEVIARSSSTQSQRTASEQSLARARREVGRASSEVTSLIGREADADNALTRARENQNSKTRLLSAAFRGLRSAISDGLSDALKNIFSFSTLLGVAKVALVGLAAVSLVPLLGQLSQAAGVIALLPAAIAGAASVFGTLKVALNGVGDAFSAAKKVSDNAADDAEARAKKIESAQRAQASAADGVESAERGIVSAERSVRDAQKNSLQAQKDLTSARKTAKRDIDDLNRALARTTLNEESAAISVAEAYKNLYDVFSDTNSTAIDKAKAQLQVKEALADQQDVLEASKRTAEDAAEANRKGVEGADSVVAAKEKVTSAAEAEQDAQQNLTDAYKTLSKAQESLADAAKDLDEALNKPSDSVKDFEKAMGKLSPAAQDFVKKILEVKPALQDLKKAIQENFFSGLGDSVKNLATNWIPTLQTGLGGIAEQINGGVRRALADLDTDASRSKLSTIFGNVKESIGPLIDGINNLVQGFLSLSEVGSGFFPDMSKGFLGLTERFRSWAESPEGQEKFKGFIEESINTFNELVNIAKEFGGVVNGLFKGSDDVGETWLQSIKNTLHEWNAFLGTPEGQQKVKDFFTDVKSIVSDIVDAIKLGASILGTFKGAPEKPGGDKNNSGAKTPERLEPGADKKAGEARQIWDAADNDQGFMGKTARGFNSLFGYNNETDQWDGGVWKDDRWGGNLRNFNNAFDTSKIVQYGADALSSYGSDQLKALKTAWSGTMSALKAGADKGGEALSWVKDKLGDLGTAAKDYITDKARTALDGFRDHLPSLSSVARLVTGDTGGFFKGLGGSVTDVIGNMLGDNGFEKLKSGMSGLASFLTGGEGLDKIKSAFGGLPEFFKGLADRLGISWSGLGDKIKGPLNSLIDILNSGLGGAWNAVANLLGSDKKWTDIPRIGEGGDTGGRAGTPLHRATGGPIYGPGGPTEDRVPIMASAGEHMWTAAEVQAAGGHEAMYRMRKSVLSGGGKQSKDGHFAVGGNVTFGSDADRWMADVIQSAFSNATITSALRPGDSGFHGKGEAIDIDGPLQQIANWIYSAYPESTQLIYGPGPLLYNARGYRANPANQAELQGIYANDLAGHFDHVHWANVAPLANLSADQQKSLWERVKSSVGAIVGGGRNLAVDNLVEKPLRAMADSVPTFSGLGAFGTVPKDFANKIVDTVLSTLKGSIGSGSAINYTPSAGVEQWRSLVVQILKAKGLPETYTDRVLMQMQSESSGNPRAQNNTDENAKRGTPSKGLMQVIDPTFRAHADPGYNTDIWDPESNIRAGLNWALYKYGSLDEAFTGHGYDQGGIWPNMTAGWNTSGLPEAVLTNPQWKALRDFGQGLGILQKDSTPTPNPGTTVEGQILPDSTQVSNDPLLSESVNSNEKVGLDTWKTLGAKTKERFQSVWDTGLTDLIDSNLGALGIDDPRNIPLYKQATAYKDTWDEWQKKKAAAAQASQALTDSGYYNAGQNVTGAANQATSTMPDGQQVSNDNSTTINIYPADVDEGYRKAQQIADLRALTKTARGN
ncbi:transglycosylase SLT domain-containing protein [Nocardia sp. NPDC056611]|uniref:transglycosylase SLT domain-containing protein n=1 Tax=Nocardia sp. NPDC056611 TaxID=3345877 RepID=UPI003672DD73